MTDREIEQLGKMKFVKEVYPEPTQTAINNLDDRINEVNRHYEQRMNELIKTPYSKIEMDSLIFSYNAEIIPLSKAKAELIIHSAPIRFYKEGGHDMKCPECGSEAVFEKCKPTYDCKCGEPTTAEMLLWLFRNTNFRINDSQELGFYIDEIWHVFDFYWRTKNEAIKLAYDWAKKQEEQNEIQ